MFLFQDAFETFISFLNSVLTSGTIFVTNVINIESALAFINTQKPTKYGIIPSDVYNLDVPFNNIFKVSLIYKNPDDDSLLYWAEPVLIQAMEKEDWVLTDRVTGDQLSKSILYENEGLIWIIDLW